MGREERNRKISELRGSYPCKFSGCDHSTCNNGVYDWHADANWPTLLREMPDFHLAGGFDHGPDEKFYCIPDDPKIEAVWASTIEDAVCEAWLHWKAGLSENAS